MLDKKKFYRKQKLSLEISRLKLIYFSEKVLKQLYIAHSTQINLETVNLISPAELSEQNDKSFSCQKADSCTIWSKKAGISRRLTVCEQMRFALADLLSD